MFLLLKYQILLTFLFKNPKKKNSCFSPCFHMESPFGLRRGFLDPSNIGFQHQDRLMKSSSETPGLFCRAPALTRSSHKPKHADTSKPSL